jgi:hypothetical protein
MKLQNLKPNSRNREIKVPIVCISTAHLTRQEAEEFDKRQHDLPFIGSTTYGYAFETIDASDIKSAAWPHCLTERLRLLLSTLRSKGFFYVLFDRDGPVIDDLEKFDW